jgi:ABC-type multidrug transport system fused ATPase/permease subunit
MPNTYHHNEQLYHQRSPQEIDSDDDLPSVLHSNQGIDSNGDEPSVIHSDEDYQHGHNNNNNNNNNNIHSPRNQFQQQHQQQYPISPRNQPLSPFSQNSRAQDNSVTHNSGFQSDLHSPTNVKGAQNEDSVLEEDEIGIDLGTGGIDMLDDHPHDDDHHDDDDNNNNNNNSIDQHLNYDDAIDGEVLEIPLGKIFQFMKGTDYILFLLAVFSSIVNGALMPAMAIIIGMFTEKATQVSTMLSSANQIAYILLVFAAVSSVSTYINISCWIVFAERQCRQIRYQYLLSLVRSEVAYHDMQSIGEIMVKLVANIDKIRDGIGQKLGQAIQAVSGFLIGLGIAFYYGWALALVIIACIPVLLIFAGITSAFTAASTTQEQAHAETAGGIASQTFSGITVVKALKLEDWQLYRYIAAQKDWLQVSIKKGWLQGISFGGFMLIIFTMYGVGFYVGSTFIRDSVAAWPGKLYTGARVLTIFYALVLSVTILASMGPQLRAIDTAKVAAYPLFETIHRLGQIDPFATDGKHIDPDKFTGRVKFELVTFQYPSRQQLILLDLDILFSPGYNALIGGSGCGKSTILQLIERYYDPQHGEVLIEVYDGDGDGDGDNETELKDSPFCKNLQNSAQKKVTILEDKAPKSPGPVDNIAQNPVNVVQLGEGGKVNHDTNDTNESNDNNDKTITQKTTFAMYNNSESDLGPKSNRNNIQLNTSIQEGNESDVTPESAQNSPKLTPKLTPKTPETLQTTPEPSQKPPQPTRKTKWIPIHELHIHSYRNLISQCHQEPVVFAGSIRENLLIANPRATDDEMLEVLEYAGLSEFVKSLPAKLDQLVSNKVLSGGQQQRVCFARSLLADKPILLLDEFCASLDIRTTRIVHEGLAKWAAIPTKNGQKKTIISVTHKLSTIRDADQIYALDQGHVQQHGTHDELFQDEYGYYRRLLNEQIEFEEAQRKLQEERDFLTAQSYFYLQAQMMGLNPNSPQYQTSINAQPMLFENQLSIGNGELHGSHASPFPPHSIDTVSNKDHFIQNSSQFYDARASFMTATPFRPNFGSTVLASAPWVHNSINGSSNGSGTGGGVINPGVVAGGVAGRTSILRRPSIESTSTADFADPQEYMTILPLSRNDSLISQPTQSLNKGYILGLMKAGPGHVNPHSPQPPLYLRDSSASSLKYPNNHAALFIQTETGRFPRPIFTSSQANLSSLDQDHRNDGYDMDLATPRHFFDQNMSFTTQFNGGSNLQTSASNIYQSNGAHHVNQPMPMGNLGQNNQNNNDQVRLRPKPRDNGVIHNSNPNNYGVDNSDNVSKLGDNDSEAPLKPLPQSLNLQTHSLFVPDQSLEHEHDKVSSPRNNTQLGRNNSALGISPTSQASKLGPKGRLTIDNGSHSSQPLALFAANPAIFETGSAISDDTASNNTNNTLNTLNTLNTNNNTLTNHHPSHFNNNNLHQIAGSEVHSQRLHSLNLYTGPGNTRNTLQPMPAAAAGGNFNNGMNTRNTLSPNTILFQNTLSSHQPSNTPFPMLGRVASSTPVAHDLYIAPGLMRQASTQHPPIRIAEPIANNKVQPRGVPHPRFRLHIDVPDDGSSHSYNNLSQNNFSGGNHHPANNSSTDTNSNGIIIPDLNQQLSTQVYGNNSSRNNQTQLGSPTGNLPVGTSQLKTIPSSTMSNGSGNGRSNGSGNSGGNIPQQAISPRRASITQLNSPRSNNHNHNNTSGSFHQNQPVSPRNYPQSPRHQNHPPVTSSNLPNTGRRASLAPSPDGGQRDTMASGRETGITNTTGHFSFNNDSGDTQSLQPSLVLPKQKSMVSQASTTMSSLFGLTTFTTTQRGNMLDDNDKGMYSIRTKNNEHQRSHIVLPKYSNEILGAETPLQLQRQHSIHIPNLNSNPSIGIGGNVQNGVSMMEHNTQMLNSAILLAQHSQMNSNGRESLYFVPESLPDDFQRPSFHQNLYLSMQQSPNGSLIYSPQQGQYLPATSNTSAFRIKQSYPDQYSPHNHDTSFGITTAPMNQLHGGEPHSPSMHLSNDDFQQGLLVTKVGITPEEEARLEKEAKDKEKATKILIPVLKRLFPFAGKYPILLSMGLICAAIEACGTPAYAMLLKYVCDSFFLPDHAEMMKKTKLSAILFVCIGLGYLLFGTLRIGFLSALGDSVTHDIRKLAFRVITFQELGSFFDIDHHTQAILSTLLANDVTHIRTILTDLVADVTICFAMFIASISISYVQGWQLTTVMIGLLPILAGAAIIQHFFLTRGSQSKHLLDNPTQNVSEALTHIRVIAAYRREQHVLHAFTEASDAYLSSESKRAHIAGFWTGLSYIALFGSYAFTFWFGGWLISKNQLAPLGLITIFTAMQMTAGQISQKLQNSAAYTASLQHCLAIFNLIHYERPIMKVYFADSSEDDVTCQMLNKANGIKKGKDVKTAQDGNDQFVSGGLVSQHSNPFLPGLDQIDGQNGKLLPESKYKHLSDEYVMSTLAEGILAVQEQVAEDKAERDKLRAQPVQVQQQQQQQQQQDSNTTQNTPNSTKTTSFDPKSKKSQTKSHFVSTHPQVSELKPLPSQFGNKSYAIEREQRFNSYAIDEGRENGEQSGDVEMQRIENKNEILTIDTKNNQVESAHAKLARINEQLEDLGGKEFKQHHLISLRFKQRLQIQQEDLVKQMTQYTISFSRVFFSYPTRPQQLVFNSLQLTIPGGKYTCVVGTSGSGKSSILSLLLRLYDPTPAYQPPQPSPLQLFSPSMTSGRYPNNPPQGSQLQKQLTHGPQRLVQQSIVFSHDQSSQYNQYNSTHFSTLNSSNPSHRPILSPLNENSRPQQQPASPTSALSARSSIQLPMNSTPSEQDDVVNPTRDNFPTMQLASPKKSISKRSNDENEGEGLIKTISYSQHHDDMSLLNMSNVNRGSNDAGYDYNSYSVGVTHRRNTNTPKLGELQLMMMTNNQSPSQNSNSSNSNLDDKNKSLRTSAITPNNNIPNSKSGHSGHFATNESSEQFIIPEGSAIDLPVNASASILDRHNIPLALSNVPSSTGSVPRFPHNESTVGPLIAAGETGGFEKRQRLDLSLVPSLDVNNSYDPGSEPSLSVNGDDVALNTPHKSQKKILKERDVGKQKSNETELTPPRHPTPTTPNGATTLSKANSGSQSLIDDGFITVRAANAPPTMLLQEVFSDPDGGSAIVGNNSSGKDHYHQPPSTTHLYRQASAQTRVHQLHPTQLTHTLTQQSQTMSTTGGSTNGSTLGQPLVLKPMVRINVPPISTLDYTTQLQPTGNFNELQQLQAMSGSVTIDGVDIRTLTSSTLRGLIGFVSQFPVLFTGSIMDNLKCGNNWIPDSQVYQACSMANIHKVIMSLPEQYNTILGGTGSGLSGGQRARLSLARTLILNNPILLLDELHSNLDAESADSINQALEHYVKGKTVVMIAHRLDLVANCDNIVVLNAGSVVEQGTHEELLKLGGWYAELYQTSLQGH